MKSIIPVLLILLTSSFAFAQDDYECEKLTKDQGIAGLIVNAEVKEVPDFAKKLESPATATTCYRCLDEHIEAYTVSPKDIGLEKAYGLTVSNVELFYEPYLKRDANDDLYVESYTLVGIVIQLDLPEDEEVLGDFQTGLFDDYAPILDSFGITERGERLQWLGGGNCGVMMSIDMSFRLHHYREKGLKTLEWNFVSACGG